MLNISPSTARKAFWVLLIPILELVALRVYLHAFLGLRFGFVKTTDFDFIFPAPLAFLVLFHALEQGQPVLLRAQRRFAIINALAFFSFIFLNQFYQSAALVSSWGVVSLWFILLSVVILSAFCLWVKPSYYLTNVNRAVYLPCVLIASSMYFYMNGFHYLWSLFGALTSTIIHEIFTIARITNVAAVFTPEDALKITHPLLNVRISQGCGGLDSIFFFTLVFLVVGSLNAKKLRTYRWLQIYVGGIFSMYCLNIFRIIFLFFSGILLRQTLGFDTGTKLFVALFHMHFGWILYSVGMYVYLKSWSARIKLAEAPLVPFSLAAISAPG
jgi:exosortase/archaeosortase family protein